jgi:LEA14-like dessication related protein
MDLSNYGFWGNGEPKYSWLFECPTFNSDSTKVYYSATLVQRDQNGNIKYNYENGDPIAYVADTWQVGVDGNGWGPVRPTFEKASEMYPQCSPKTGKIAQTQMMGGMTDYVTTIVPPGVRVGVAQNAGLFTINPDGSGQHKVVAAYYVAYVGPGLTITDSIQPLTCAWSPDGTKMAIVYYVAYSGRPTGVQSNYYFAISVVDPNTTTDCISLSDNIYNADYCYGTKMMTPVGWPAQGTPSIFNCDGIGKITWSSDGKKLAFDVGRISTDLVTQSYGNVWSIDVTNLNSPGAPYNITRDNISYYPVASPANLGTQIAPPVPAAPAYLAEGTTRPNFDEFLALANPNNTDIDVLLKYALGGGAGKSGGASSQTVHIKANSRATVKVRDTVGDNQDVSVSATCDKGVIVERPMYFNYGADKGYNWTGGHDVVGANCALKNWYFAEGTTRRNSTDGAYDEYLCLQNPDKADATVTITYMLGTGENKTQKMTVKANSRSTVNVNDFLGPDQDVSCKVTSDQGIVAERPIYFNYKNKWNGGHDVIGASAPATDWYFAEGTTRDNAADGSYEEWLCLQNPQSTAAKVTITYMLGSGENKNQEVTVKANSRSTVSVNGFLGPNQDVSCKVHSDKEIVAERPVYFNTRNGWNGGHDVIGATGPKTNWYFAEGTTRDNFSEWLCLQNPGATDANVTITYLLASGQNIEQKIVVKAKSRSTVDVKLKIGPNQDASAKVISDQGIIAERPMYFNYNGVWTGGHDVIGYSP